MSHFKDLIELFQITVIVSDVNDNAPTFRASTEQLVFSVQENSPGKEVARILADDRDVGENGTITYSIESQIPRTRKFLNIIINTTFKESEESEAKYCSWSLCEYTTLL